MRKQVLKNALLVLLGLSYLSSCNLFFNKSEPSNVNDFIPVFDNTVSNSYESKRGICYNNLSKTKIDLLSGKYVTWGYNWGKTPENNYIGPNKSLEFTPMFWGGASDQDIQIVRDYLTANPGVKILLGFNEPNMGNAEGGCNMLPSTAASLWPKLESLASEFNLELASPAMTYSGYTLSNGKVYGSPDAWLDEFISEYKNLYGKDPRMDYIVLHSYMAWPSSVLSYCEQYGKMYNKKVLLTEFCAWHDEGQTIDAAWQAEKLSQKIEAMDQSEWVAGYAWFKADGEVNNRPWNSFFNGNQLTLCGLIYQHLSGHDKGKYYEPEVGIPAVSYISSSNYNTTVGSKAEDGARYNTPLKFGFSTDPSSYQEVPLFIENFGRNSFVNYQINVLEDGDYDVTIRYLSNGDQTISVNNTSFSFESTNEYWCNYYVTVPLKAGKQTLNIKSSGSASKVQLAWVFFKKH